MDSIKNNVVREKKTKILILALQLILSESGACVCELGNIYSPHPGNNNNDFIFSLIRSKGLFKGVG